MGAPDEVLLVLRRETVPEAPRPVKVDLVHRGEGCDRAALYRRSRVSVRRGRTAGIGASHRCTLRRTETYGPLLMRLVNVRTWGKLDLAERGHVVGSRTLVSVDVHPSITLKVRHGGYGGVDGDLLVAVQ